MPLDDFRAVYFPYCIERQADGKYVVLNREYKPVGFNTKEFIKYDKYPVKVALKLTPSRVTKLADGGENDGDRIYLYGDSTNPLRSKNNFDRYLEKLRLLATLEVS